MIRDNRKDDKYFDAFIVYQKERIRKKEEKLLSCSSDESKADRINLSLMKFKMDLLFAEFSAGYNKSQLVISLESAINTAIDMTKIDYESLLNLLAITIFLDSRTKLSELIDKHKNVILEDKLLKLFAVYLETEEIIWNGEFTVSKVYSKLENLDTASNKVDVLLDYLYSWYLNHRDTSWYESDKGKNDTYVGYWSFESAAIAKIFKLAENKLIKNEYYPVL